MKPVRIPIEQARKLAVRAQGLDASWAAPPGRDGTLAVLERLGYAQIDAIAVIERAHHHTLWTRHDAHVPEMLDALLSEDRRVFEWWARQAAYVPMHHYRYYVRRMRAAAELGSTREWLDANREVVNEVLDRIRTEGPLGAADFKDPRGRRRGSWWDWKPAKRALETLFWTGELMVTKRRNFQRLYDLKERVLPPDQDTSAPDLGEETRFHVRRTLRAHGVGEPWVLSHGDKKALTQAADELVANGEAVLVEVDGLGDRLYSSTDLLDAAETSVDAEPPVHLLSPFDNLTIDRRRLLALFDFDYRLECYVPAEKREFGYFVLPILWGDCFVGRLDPKADRKAKALLIRNLVFETGFREVDEFLPILANKLHAFALFNGCDSVSVEQTAPKRLKAPLVRALTSVG